jgi:hypothetical protein
MTDPWKSKFNPGDLVLLVAQFADGKPRRGLIVRAVRSHMTSTGYYVLVNGKNKYFPPHLLRVISRAGNIKKKARRRLAE